MDKTHRNLKSSNNQEIESRKKTKRSLENKIKFSRINPGQNWKLYTYSLTHNLDMRKTKETRKN